MGNGFFATKMMISGAKFTVVTHQEAREKFASMICSLRRLSDKKKVPASNPKLVLSRERLLECYIWKSEGTILLNFNINPNNWIERIGGVAALCRQSTGLQ